MANPFDEIRRMRGLMTHPNAFTAPDGAMLVADEAEIPAEDICQPRRGYMNYSTNLPDATPQQLFSFGGTLYAHIDNSLWYFDGAMWLRKRGAFGSANNSPLGCCYLNNHLYVTHGNAIVDINLSTGVRTVLAGRYNAAPAHTDGTGDAARFSIPWGICTDGTDLYVCDATNHGIRKVTTAGVVTSLAGSATNVNAHTEGTGNAARFDTPTGICWDGSNLIVADSGNNCIRKVTLAGVVTTLAGPAAPATTSGYTNGNSTASRFNAPIAIAGPYGAGNFLVCDFGNNCIRLVSSSGSSSTLAGPAAPATTSGHTDANGSAARFNGPYGITIVGTSEPNVYISDRDNNCVRLHVLTTAVTTPFGVAAPGTASGSVDGIGNAASFKEPAGLATDGTNLFCCDKGNNMIRKIYLDTGYVATIDGTAGYSAVSTGLPFANGIIVGPG